MAIQLRDYQQDLLEKVQTALNEGGTRARVMMQLPTGGGKTEVAGALIADWLNQRRRSKAVWLTHREHLQTQTYNRLLGTDAKPDNPETVDWPVGSPAPVRRNGTAILSANTAGRRANAGETQLWSNYSRNDLLVIDEAHHAAAPTWVKAIEQWPGRVVGLTATPSRLAGEVNLAEVFNNNLICGPQIRYLQEQGWLCYAEVRKPESSDIIKGGSRQMGEYTMVDVERVNEQFVMTASVLNFWEKYAVGRQTIAYAVTIQHANNLASVFNDAGIPARAITSQTSAENRNDAIEGFRIGDIKVLVNVAIATEGFDLPDASCIILARPTLSRSLYLQMVGRGLRRKQDGGNCIILDPATNSDRHGLPDDERPCGWDDHEPGGPGHMPMVICSKCGTESPAAVHFCSNPDCREPFGKVCGRCGKWRSNALWPVTKQTDVSRETAVCYLCHRDVGWDTDLLARLIERIQELEKLIDENQEAMSEGGMDVAFDAYIDGLPAEDRPSSPAAIGRMFAKWAPAERTRLEDEVNNLETELGRMTERLRSQLPEPTVS